MVRFKWIRCRDCQPFETTCDSTYRNYKANGWAAIAEMKEPWGVYENLTEIDRSTEWGRGVITADSKPERTIKIESEELCDEVLRGLRDEPGMFGRLFQEA